MGLVLDDDLYDAQLVRAIAYTRCGGAELGECVQTARRITAVDGELWYREWTATAQRVRRDAEDSLRAGHRAGARDAFLRASNYHRTAGLFLMGAPVDARFRDSAHAQTATFRAAAELFDRPPQILGIPYRDTTLPGYFFRAGDGDEPRPTLILTDGYDGTVEELWFANGAAALDRGYHVIAFDGPGQGSVLLDQGIVFRPDWDNVVGPVLDHVLELPGVDPARIALMGWSFGGYTAPRAATAEHRLAACVSDSGPYDLLGALRARIPRPLTRNLPHGTVLTRPVLAAALRSVLRRPSAGWSLRRNLWVHGVDDPLELLGVLADYTLAGREHLIRCPTFVCRTAGDDLTAAAPTFAARLTCPSRYVEFGPADGVTGHCEMTGRAVFHREVFDWLDEVLA